MVGRINTHRTQAAKLSCLDRALQPAATRKRTLSLSVLSRVSTSTLYLKASGNLLLRSCSNFAFFDAASTMILS